MARLKNQFLLGIFIISLTTEGFATSFIGHIVPRASHPNKAIEIKASIVDDVEVTGANVYYRKGTEGLFSSIPMSLLDGTSSIYSATIPADGVTFEGIQYYIEAKDSEGIRYDPPLGLSSPYQIDVSKIFFKPNGPSIVAYIWAMVMDPKNNNVLYLSADYGYYKSIDAGRTWKAIGAAVKDGKENTAHGAGPALALDPSTPTTVYVAPLADCGGDEPAGRGIYKSTDGGNNFINIGLPGNQIYGITPDRANPGRLYVCRSEGRFASGILRYGSLWRSDNSGETFYELDVIKQAIDPAMSVITIDPTSQGKVLYGGTWGFGIYKSEDGGITWKAINNGLPFMARILPKGITVNPATSTIVYALEMDNGVYRSMDGGQSWTQINSGLNPLPSYFPQADRNGSQLVVDPNDPLTLYLPTRNGAYKSIDNGDNWVEKNNADIVEDFLPSSWYLGGNSMVIDHKNPDTVYYGCEGGIFKSTNKGEYWTKTNRGLHCVFAWTITPGTSAGYVYLGTAEQRLYKTTDYGQTWRQIPGQAPNTIGYPYAYLGMAGPLVINPSTPTTIYAAGSNGWGFGFDGYTIYKSIDDGNNWVKKAKGLPPPEGKEDDDVRWYAVAIDPVNPDILYCGGGCDQKEFGIYKTTNAGEDWFQTSKTTGRFWNIKIDPKNPNVIYAASAYGPDGEYGLWKSTNAGEGTWTQSLSGKSVRDIAIHPLNTSILYAATLDGLYKTTDAGQTWTLIAPGRPISIEIDPFVPDVLYAENWEADNFVAMYRSPDNGCTWQIIKDTQYGANMSGSPLLKIDALKIDPNIPNKVYFCTWGEGFWQSEVQPGTHTAFGVYTPPQAVQGKPFKAHIVALDSDKFTTTDYSGIVTLSVDKGNISPSIVSNFVNGVATLSITLDTAETITITVKDSQNQDKIGTKTIFILPSSNSLPFIGHIVPRASHPNKAIEIKASIVDDVEVTGANVYYRKGTEGLFSSIPMSLVDGTSSIYSATIPANDVIFPGIQYYIEARDNEGIRYDPLNYADEPYLIKVSKAVVKPIGPYMGYAWTLAINPKNPNVIYILADYGIWKSIDKGRSWREVGGRVFQACGATAIAISPSTPTTLYIAGVYKDFGICKSEDGGNSWKKIGLKDWYIYGIAVDPYNPDVVYAGISSNKYIFDNPNTTGGIFKSTDGGKTWGSLIEVNSDKTPITTIAINPVSTNTLYAGSWGKGVYKSTDGGITWDSVDTGVSYLYVIPRGITINPVSYDTVYLLVQSQYNGGNYNILRTKDGGNTWEAINAGLSPYGFYCAGRFGTNLAVDPNHPNRLYLGQNGGIYKSTNNGDWWFIISTDVKAEPLIPRYLLTSLTSLAVNPKDSDNVYASSAGGFFRSENAGGSWTQSNQGFQNIWSHRIEIDPKDSKNIYVGTGEIRGYKTENSGETWKQLHNNLQILPDWDYNDQMNIDRIVIDPKEPTTIYAALYGGDWETIKQGVLCKSIDSGNTWGTKTNGLPEKVGIRGLAIAPGNPSILYAGIDYPNGIYKSIDGAESWSYSGLSGNQAWQIAIDPKDPNIVYAGIDEGEIGVFKSTDGGGTWTKVLNKIVRDIAIDFRDTNIIYVACDEDGGLWKSENGGKSWNKIRDGYFSAVVLDPRTSDVVYAESWNGKIDIIRSVDRGENWKVFIPQTEAVSPLCLKRGSLKLDQTTPNRLYFTTWGVGSFICEAIPGELDHFKVYTPATATVSTPFELEVIALDEDSWIKTDYQNTVKLSVDKGNISPTEVSNFVNGIATLSITLDTPCTITITAKDKDKLGTATIFIEGPYVTIKKEVRNITRNTGYEENIDGIAGDRLEYRLVLTNTGNKTANFVVVIDVLPDGVVYEANSIKIDDKSQTDECDSDKANFISNTITIGKDKGETTGNGEEISIPPSGTVTILYQVRIKK
ncbi:MAG: hypothetical protein AB1630_02005 [bacterium]